MASENRCTGHSRIPATSRAAREIAHGAKLASSGAETIWGWGTLAGQLRAQRRATLIATSAGLSPGVKVLEIGCGTGLFTSLFAQTGAFILAVDISADLLAQARARELPAERVQFLEKRFEDCTGLGPFDAIIGSSVLHHLDIVPALARICELLKPGGVMAFAEPNMLNPQIAIQKNVPWVKQRMGDSEDETAFTRWQMNHLLEQAGFVDVEIKPYDWLHPATPPGLVRAVNVLGQRLERVPFLREFSGSLLFVPGVLRNACCGWVTPPPKPS